MTRQMIKLDTLPSNQVPADLRPETYFDFEAHPFAHQQYVRQAHSVFAAIHGIEKYATQWLADAIAAGRTTAAVLQKTTPSPTHAIGQFRVLLEPGAQFEPALILGTPDRAKAHTIYVARDAKVFGAHIYLDEGDIYIGPGALVEPGAGIRGPTIVGGKTEILQGAYLRRGCLIGDDCALRGEIKNSIVMDRAAFPHPSYLGDSICGYMTHFGNQATTANLGLYAGMVESKKRRPLVVTCGKKRYDLGKPKMGICMGDFSQVGCNSVSDPATFLKPWTVVYPLSRIPKGFYGPREVLKNKPLEHGIIERSPLRSLNEPI